MYFSPLLRHIPFMWPNSDRLDVRKTKLSQILFINMDLENTVNFKDS